MNDFRRAMLVAAVAAGAIFPGKIRAGGLCKEWAPARPAGVLDHKLIEEASGLAVSSDYDRLYHINDSGDGPFFYQTDLSGRGTQRIEVRGFEPEDVESLGYGPCGKGRCLFIADIGDNKHKRERVTLVLVREVERFEARVKPYRLITARYPDGPRDAEALAVHPGGDVFIMSKEADYKERRAKPARVYRLSKTALLSRAPGDRQLEFIGELDVPWLNFEENLWGRLVTGLDIAPGGDRFLVLTYKNALEFSFDLARGALPDARGMKKGRDFSVVPLRALRQQEAVSYLPDGSGFLYDTEFKEDEGRAELFKVVCVKR